MSRFSPGLRLARQGWALLQGHRELTGFPVLGAVLGLVVVTPLVVAARFTTSGHAPQGFSEEDLRSAVRTHGSAATV